MATAPFDIDDTVPADTDVVSTFPAVERTFRDIVEDWINTEHDPSGHHAIPNHTTVARDAITDWVVGSLVYDTTLNELLVATSIDPDVWAPAQEVDWNTIAEVDAKLALQDTVAEMTDYTALTPWTPVLAFGGASVGVTYGTQIARYIKVGARVTVWGTIILSSNGSSTGSATITGLPVAASTVAGLVYGGSLRMDASALGTHGMDCSVASGASAIDLFFHSSGDSIPHNDTTVVDVTEIYFSVTYPTG